MSVSSVTVVRAATAEPTLESTAKWNSPPNQKIAETMDVDNDVQSSAVKQDRKLGL